MLRPINSNGINMANTKILITMPTKTTWHNNQCCCPRKTNVKLYKFNLSIIETTSRLSELNGFRKHLKNISILNIVKLLSSLKIIYGKRPNSNSILGKVKFYQAKIIFEVGRKELCWRLMRSWASSSSKYAMLEE